MKTVTLTTACLLGLVASPSFAVRTESGAPLPSCDTRNAARAPWRPAVQAMNEDAARDGGATGAMQPDGSRCAPALPTGAAMDACIRHRVTKAGKLQPAARAE
ncbi:MAG: hypothetical protein KatS3mg082_2138 [Nitrospiraceae bacterium]|nr:MAG: hypothetical protein KatS3mg082_2138 [Nitrospiraceae bacterium]